MKKTTIFLVMAMVVLIALSVGFTLDVQAQGSGHKEEQSPKAKGGEEVTVTGQNYCVGCTLKKAHGAGAQCSIVGHWHALKVNEARNEKGKKISKMKGWTLHYLSNTNGKELRDGHHGEELKLAGTVYKDERVIDVQKNLSAKGSTAKGSDSK